MPTKQEIEAELNASDIDRAVAKAREMFADWQEWEASLRAAERKVWQPHWSHDDPYRERLRRVGKTEKEIAEFERRLEAIRAIVLGKTLPVDLQKGTRRRKRSRRFGSGATERYRKGASR
jgi:hypothetical protein